MRPDSSRGHASSSGRFEAVQGVGDRAGRDVGGEGSAGDEQAQVEGPVEQVGGEFEVGIRVELVAFDGALQDSLECVAAVAPDAFGGLGELKVLVAGGEQGGHDASRAGVGEHGGNVAQQRFEVALEAAGARRGDMARGDVLAGRNHERRLEG